STSVTSSTSTAPAVRAAGARFSPDHSARSCSKPAAARRRFRSSSISTSFATPARAVRTALVRRLTAFPIPPSIWRCTAKRAHTWRLSVHSTSPRGEDLDDDVTYSLGYPSPLLARAAADVLRQRDQLQPARHRRVAEPVYRD